MSELVMRADLNGVRTVTMNRPDHRNGLTVEMQERLIAEFEAAGDASVRVMVLAGAGEAFCAGLDLEALKAIEGKGAEEREGDARRLARVYQALYEVPVPTIAAVHGHAVAGGAGLATICDFTMALAGSKIGFTEARIGYVPALVAAYLGLQVGEKRARELLLTGRIFTAEEAFRIGAVTEVIPWELGARVQGLARELMENSPAALRATKSLLREQNKGWLEAALAGSVEAMKGDGEVKEGVAAFVEGRKPVWG